MLEDDSIPFNVYLFGQYRKVFKSEKLKSVKVGPLTGIDHGHHIEKNTQLKNHLFICFIETELFNVIA